MSVVKKLKEAFKLSTKAGVIAGIAAGIMVITSSISHTTAADTKVTETNKRIVDIQGIPKCSQILDNLDRLYTLWNKVDNAPPDEKKKIQQEMRNIVQKLLKGKEVVVIGISQQNQQGSPFCEVLRTNKNVPIGGDKEEEYRLYLDPSKDYNFVNDMVSGQRYGLIKIENKGNLVEIRGQRKAHSAIVNGGKEYNIFNANMYISMNDKKNTAGKKKGKMKL